ncbi:uncharacterized protein N7482_003285 [Penicillium canariense]|uniref:Chromo domain-containing protein n=1 Tax=Penicillium canariense TaxID=189055 RepID=A0A9W9I4E3_9EURO|nr:uncharacterized protein N7482_003285 [Penicillium canariense]KAJ5167691.1 hypothetical protein N7482_003285 [Penicillium canariense]
MADADHHSDADSLASTVASIEGSEYEVEEILFERISKKTGEKKYLLKWAEYPMHRATWEPADMFLEMDDALLNWKAKRSRIIEGIDPPFDLVKWEKDLKERRRETAKRKEARRKERVRRAAQITDFQDQDGHQPDREDDDEDVSNPADVIGSDSSPHGSTSKSWKSPQEVPLPQACTGLAPGGQLLTSRSRRESPLSDSSIVSSLFVSANTPQPDSRATQLASNQGDLLLPTSTAAQPRQALSPQSPRVGSQPPPSGPSQTCHDTLQTSPTPSSKQDTVSATEPGQKLGQILTPQAEPLREPQHQRSQALPSQVAKQPASRPPYSAFGTAKLSDREADPSQLDLRKPSEFPARLAGASSVPFAKVTTSEITRPASKIGEKSTPTYSVPSQTPTISSAPRPGSSDIIPPLPTTPSAHLENEMTPMFPQSSSRGPPFRSGVDLHRPGGATSGDSPRHQQPRQRSPESRPRSPVQRPRSAGSQPRSPEPQPISPGSRPNSPVRRPPVGPRPRSPQHWTPDRHRIPAPSPFDTVTRSPTAPKISPPRPSLVAPVYKENRANSSLGGTPISSTRPPLPPPTLSLSVDEQIKRMPIGVPEKNSMKFKNGYFVNRCEVLAHVYFGPEKVFVGVVRLCGLTSDVKKDLLASKGAKRGSFGNFEMWFKNICTHDEYTALCKAEEEAGGSNTVLRTCWMEGFANTNPDIFRMSENLFSENTVAIYYPPGLNGFVWLAYSPKSHVFTHLTQPQIKISRWIPIRLAVRTPLAPINALKFTSVRLECEPRQQVATDMAIVPSSQSAAGEREARDAPVGPFLNRAADGEHQTSRLGLSDQHTDSPSDPRLRRRSSITTSAQPLQGQARTMEMGVDKSNNHHSEGASLQEPSDIMDTSPDNTEPAHLPLATGTQNPPMSGVADPNSMLVEYFESQVRMTFKELASVTGRRNGPAADIFYLHLPENEEGQNDCTLLKAWLDLHGAIVWTDWGKFIKNSKCGIILFHESFAKYYMLRPNISDALANSSMGFWTFRISRPLDFPDLRYCQNGVYFQRIFGRGGAFLMSEDLLQDLNQALVIVCWFYGVQSSNPGAWKLVCWPSVVERLEQRLDDPNQTKDEQKLLVALLWWIRKCNSVDKLRPYFQDDSLNQAKLDAPNNNVIALTVAGYGERSEHVTPELPGGLTQTERNADHLAEAFAGWTLENTARVRKAYIISNCSNEALLKRWGRWAHVIVFSMESFLGRFKIDAKEMLKRAEGRGRPRSPSKSSKSSKSNQPSHRAASGFSSPYQTPQTPVAAAGSVRAPGEPTADCASRPRPGEWRQPHRHDADRYPAPYR